MTAAKLLLHFVSVANMKKIRTGTDLEKVAKLTCVQKNRTNTMIELLYLI